MSIICDSSSRCSAITICPTFELLQPAVSWVDHDHNQLNSQLAVAAQNPATKQAKSTQAHCCCRYHCCKTCPVQASAACNTKTKTCCSRSSSSSTSTSAGATYRRCSRAVQKPLLLTSLQAHCCTACRAALPCSSLPCSCMPCCVGCARCAPAAATTTTTAALLLLLL